MSTDHLTSGKDVTLLCYALLIEFIEKQGRPIMTYLKRSSPSCIYHDNNTTLILTLYMPISRSTAWKAHLAACLCNIFPSESFLDITSHHITGAMRVVLRFSQQQHPLDVVPTNSCRSHEGHHRIRKAPCVFPTRSNALITEDCFLTLSCSQHQGYTSCIVEYRLLQFI